jgi:hypothetical protein
MPGGNFIISSSLMISLNEGLFSGSRSYHYYSYLFYTQHLLVKRANISGVFFGITGLKSLLSTSIDTWRPVISLNINDIKFVFTSIRWLSWCYFPENNSITEDVCFFCINLSSYNFWCHPLIGTNLACHVVGHCSSPAKIC